LKRELCGSLFGLNREVTLRCHLEKGHTGDHQGANDHRWVNHKDLKPRGAHEGIGTEMGRLVDRKNAAYGHSFKKSGDFLRLLYPDGIKPEQYQDMLALVRIYDKMNRIATDKDAFGEDPFSDIVGYGLLAVGMRRASRAQEAR
jgi:hypothetical protein